MRVRTPRRLFRTSRRRTGDPESSVTPRSLAAGNIIGLQPECSSRTIRGHLFRKRKSPVRTALLITALSLSFAASTLQANEPAPRQASHGPIADAVADAGRTEANRARDSYRHPVETLSFFGVKPSDTIVEIWPGGGWYSEILGPLTRNKGKLYLAAPSRADRKSTRLNSSH